MDLDRLNYDFAWVHDKPFDARMIDEVPVLFIREDAYAWSPGMTNENKLDMRPLSIRPDAIECLRDACDKYLELLRQPYKPNRVSDIEQREVTGQ